MQRGIMAVIMLVLLAGCSSVSTKRIDPSTPTDLVGSWNDTDARLVAEEMINDCLSGSWINNFNMGNQRPPVVIVGSIKNKTFQHIDSDIFVDTLSKELLNSGKVQFVADKQARQEIREERDDQQLGNTNPATISPKGMETGADFMLQGSINAIDETADTTTLMIEKRQSTKFFQVTLELVDLKTNQKTWIGQKQIKKSVTKQKIFM